MQRNHLMIMIKTVRFCFLIFCSALVLGGIQISGQEKPKPVVNTEQNDSVVSAEDMKKGKHGTKVMTYSEGDNGEHIVKVEYKDAAGVTKWSNTEIVFKDGTRTEKFEYVDCDGREQKGEKTYDQSHNITSESYERFEAGVLKLGHQADSVNQTYKTFNKTTGRYEDRPYSEYEEMIKGLRELIERERRKSRPICDPWGNELIGGFDIINEDSDPEHFNTYGFEVSYTRQLNPTVGVTADFNANFRERFGSDLRKTSVLGGVTVRPFAGANLDDKVTVSTHALFGVSHFSADSGATTFTDNAFTMKLGGALDVNVTERFFIRPVAVDYAPTFFGNNTQHNVQVGFGLGVRF